MHSSVAELFTLTMPATNAPQLKAPMSLGTEMNLPGAQETCSDMGKRDKVASDAHEHENGHGMGMDMGMG